MKSFEKIKAHVENVTRSAMGTLRGESGAALVVALLLLLGLVAIGASTIMLSSTDFVVAGNERQHQIALDVAEAGVAEALHRMSLNPGEIVNVGGGNFDASIRDAADPPDPNWTTRIFLTAPGSTPSPSGSDFATATVQDAGSYLEYSHASDPAEALLIRHKLRDFDGDGTREVVLYDASRIPPENPNTGDPVEQVVVRGRSGTARRTVTVDAIRFPLAPNVTSALLSNGDVDLRGNVTVCGRNHRMDTPRGTQLPACSPAWEEADGGHLPGVQTTGDTVDTRGSTDLLGNPTPTDNDPTNVFLTLPEALGVTQEELDGFLENPDHSSLAGAWPREGITYHQGDGTISSNKSGSGLLYVTGDLRISGVFAWRGLIYVEGDLEITGNVWILGGVMVDGDGGVSVDFGSGTVAVVFSFDMIQQALTSSMHYIVLNWKEL